MEYNLDYTKLAIIDLCECGFVECRTIGKSEEYFDKITKIVFQTAAKGFMGLDDKKAVLNLCQNIKDIGLSDHTVKSKYNVIKILTQEIGAN